MSNMKLGSRHRNKENVINELQDPNLPIKKFIMTMPENVHTEFKLLCVQQGVSMKDVVLSKIREWIEENKI